ncbi:putative UPF0481 protein At3g02645 isoform X2 [Cynara cardunculus var. scolymus]|uniref:putative UPF0481 protein At3g02645 isoform X2 n=1 Tax=Cynara cardunculus var. scolymus TaxID=59895 RepID=UPI000D627A4F|nr:putative UPF0481 protein At3g02645 isoform X2 [Cynara cardunculus var. scolymus]
MSSRSEEQRPINLPLLDQGVPPEQILETCVQKVNASLGRIKACYGNGMKSYSDDQITRMMVMDGCFILEFIYKLLKHKFDEEMVIEPISMAFDLVLLENQIPFLVLEHIFECTSSRFQPEVASLNALIILGLIPALGFLDLKCKKNKVFDGTDHILGFIHECYRPLPLCDKLPSDSFENRILGFIQDCYRPLCDAVKKAVEKIQTPDLGIDVNAQSSEDFEIDLSSNSDKFYSAVELDRSGVNFKPHHQPSPKNKKDGKWSMDIELTFPLCFWCRPWAKPTLRMPVMRIHNYTELVFRNLIAYEQLSPGSVCHYVTSYAIAMDRLIDNHEDVARLVKSQVLINTIGSNEEAAKLINDLRKEISSPHFFYVQVWKEMNGYHDRVVPRNIAKLRRTYFSNPWSSIALFAGIFLFLFTLVQTYYTINPV